jgi:hypothetical protein
MHVASAIDHGLPAALRSEQRERDGRDRGAWTNDVAATMNVVDGRIEVSEPESGRSRRTLPVPPVMVSLLEAGVHIKAVADLLGHSSIAITGDIYGHASDAATRSAMDGLSEVFGL